ncbi:SRPBCC family protein [Saccharopolyspora cebuensis]|uniref:SRPBCC family protein n=1 Tax=Saccharopolyspora cebuensis TaxID=418759 RepID=A0ABV4CJH7_9PSEU
MTDTAQLVDALHRRVGTGAHGGRTIALTRTYDAAIADVWSACTEPDRLARWFLPVSGDLRTGGQYRLEGNASGTVERCDPPRGFTATWEFGGGTSRIELRLSTEEGGRTRLELEHSVPDDEHWAEFGPGAAGVGWDIGLLNLGLHLAGAQIQPEEEWAATEPGLRFMRLSSARWGEADIAAGAGPEQARAAAERTAAFYTGSTQ